MRHWVKLFAALTGFTIEGPSKELHRDVLFKAPTQTAPFTGKKAKLVKVCSWGTKCNYDPLNENFNLSSESRSPQYEALLVPENPVNCNPF